jgi:hypothetical protein
MVQIKYKTKKIKKTTLSIYHLKYFHKKNKQAYSDFIIEKKKKNS